MSQTKSKAGRKLNPELAVVSGRIYTSGIKDADRLILWIWRMQKTGHSDEAIRNALQMAEKRLPQLDQWWAYLTSLMPKANGRASEEESEAYKKADPATSWKNLIEGFAKFAEKRDGLVDMAKDGHDGKISTPSR